MIAVERIEARPTTLRGMTEAFLHQKRVMENCSEKTVKIYRGVLEAFLREGGEPNFLSVSKYLAGCQARIKEITVHIHFRTLKTFFRWAAEAQLLPQNPLQGVSRKCPTVYPRVPEKNVVDALLKAAGDDWYGRRNKVLVVLCSGSAVRRFEPLVTRIGEVRFTGADGGMLLVRRKGQSEGDPVPFGPKAAKIIRSWMILRAGANPEDYFICNKAGEPLHPDTVTHVFYKLCDRAGIQRWGPHKFRHFAATEMYHRTGDLQFVQKMLGHKGIEMTLRYAHISKKDVVSKFRKASPLD